VHPLKVRIVTDSTASIPPEICRALDIAVVSTIIQFGTETFVDGVDPLGEYYPRLEKAEHPPTTSTPAPWAFFEVYEKLAHEACEIISIHVMETKTTLINSARMAAGMLPGAHIHVMDSGSTSLGLGLLAMAAARLAKLGHAASEIIHEVERTVPHVHVHAAIRDMTQLRRSGRVSLGAALLANMLAIRPILYIGQSMVEVVGKARGWPVAVERMVEMAVEKAGDARVVLAVVHTNCEHEAHELMERILSRFNIVEAMVAEAGPTLATHAGAGALGVVTLPSQ